METTAMISRGAELSGSRPDSEAPEAATQPQAPKVAQAGTGAPAEHRGRPRTARRGLALIVVIGTLGVLALLAVAFVAMAQLERKASAQRVNAARAYLLARSGIEDALARLALGQDPAYGGENWDGSADGLLSDLEAAEQVFRRTPAGTPADIDACPARHAMRPSFFVRFSGGNPDPALMEVDGRKRGSSGRLSGDGSYALRASSGQGFFVNGGDPAAAASVGYNAVLRRMLGTLAEALDREDGADDGLPADETDGWRLVDARPAAGWRDFGQVRDLALGGSQAKLDALRPYLTLHAWVDRKVVAPNCSPGMEGRSYRSWGEIKLDHEETRPGSRAPDFERIGGRVVGRAPVDLAWARTRKPALIALLAGLKGLYLDETTATPAATGAGGAGVNAPARDILGTLRATEFKLDWAAPTDDCRRAAGQILSSTLALDTWQAWNDFCDGLGFPDTDPNWNPAAYPASMSSSQRPIWIADLKQAKRDLLKANFNPNSGLNKFNPNPSLWRSVDKQDLLVHSSEFNLLPGIGPREVSCAGRVTGRGGLLLASRTLRALLPGPRVARLTTQKEFVCEDLGKLDIAGDETDFRLPGRFPFLSRNMLAGTTWGHALPGLGNGAGLQTHPEPVVDDGSGLSINPADYDGSIQLATIETPADASYGVGAATRDMKLLARYTTGFDLDLADAVPGGEDQLPPLYIHPGQNHPDFHQVTSRCTGKPGALQVDQGPPKMEELRHSLLDAAKPNTLHPDGCYAEKDRAPEYLDQGNADGFHGVLSFWVKSGHRAPAAWSNTPRGHPLVKWTNVTDGTPVTFTSTNQFFFLGDVHPAQTNYQPGLLCQFEIGHAPADSEMEHRFVAPRGLTPRRWHLVTLFWDFRSPTADDAGELVVDDGAFGRDDVYRAAVTGASERNNAALAADITLPDLFGAHRIGLGRGHPLHEGSVTGGTGSGADATFDEFAIWDFGGAPPAATPLEAPAVPPGALESPATLAFARYREGRYGRSRFPAHWFSAPLDLDGARILGLAWTPVLPPELPEGRVLLTFSNVTATGDPMFPLWENPAWSPSGLRVEEPFRLQASFYSNPPDALNIPILDPLALDDVTVVYEPAGGPALLAWEESPDE